MSLRNYKEPKLLYGFGINDLKQPTKDSSGKHIPAYETWRGIIRRCYDANFQTALRNVTYTDCIIDDRWRSFTAFKEWFEDPENGYQPGYTIDKDVVVHGNKVYAPETCILIPRELNMLFIKDKAKRGELPIGVYYNKKLNKYSASVQGRENGQQPYLGLFPTIEEAFMAYKKEKESIIKHKANEYYSKGLISRRAYDAMMSYEVLITD